MALTASRRYQDWDVITFMSFLREHQMQVFSLNNRLRPLDPDRRFGSLHFAYGVLANLPAPIDRIFDAITGDAAPRLTLARRPPPPAANATLHLTASPAG